MSPVLIGSRPSSSLAAFTLFALVLASAPSTAFAQAKPRPNTKTSTSTFRFPEEGGPLPRARMPEGSAEPEVGPGESAPPSGESPKGEAPASPGSPEVPTHPGGAEGAGPRPGEDAEVRPGEDAEVRPGEGVESKPGEDQAEKPKPKITLSWNGYLRVLAESVENDPESTFIGRNDGFRIGNARLGFTAAYGERFSAFMSIEASMPRSDELNAANAEFTVGPRDLVLNALLSKYAGLSLGRFKPPYDLGELEDEFNRTFIEIPLESRGVLPTQGFEVLGMRPGRQIGVMLHRSRVGLSEEGFDVGYALALTNGRTLNFILNDNDRPAGYARFSLFYGSWLQVNLGGFTDTRTVGELPNLFDEEVKGAEGSLVLTLGDLRVEGQLLFQRVEFETTGAPHVNLLGVHAQWSYRFYGLEAGYRFAYFDPNHRFDVDVVSEHTLALSYYFADLPLRLSINGTLVQEQDGRELENNRISFLTQYIF